MPGGHGARHQPQAMGESQVLLNHRREVKKAGSPSGPCPGHPARPALGEAEPRPARRKPGAGSRGPARFLSFLRPPEEPQVGERWPWDIFLLFLLLPQSRRGSRWPPARGHLFRAGRAEVAGRRHGPEVVVIIATKGPSPAPPRPAPTNRRFGRGPDRKSLFPW